jgi:hypothetical protein
MHTVPDEQQRPRMGFVDRRLATRCLVTDVQRRRVGSAQALRILLPGLGAMGAG